MTYHFILARAPSVLQFLSNMQPGKKNSDPEYQNCQFISHEFCGILKSFHMPYQKNILKHKKCHTAHDEYGMQKKNYIHGIQKYTF